MTCFHKKILIDGKISKKNGTIPEKGGSEFPIYGSKFSIRCLLASYASRRIGMGFGLSGRYKLGRRKPFILLEVGKGCRLGAESGTEIKLLMALGRMGQQLCSHVIDTQTVDVVAERGVGILVETLQHIVLVRTDALAKYVEREVGIAPELFVMQHNGYTLPQIVGRRKLGGWGGQFFCLFHRHRKDTLMQLEPRVVDDEK